MDYFKDMRFFLLSHLKVSQFIFVLFKDDCPEVKFNISFIHHFCLRYVGYHQILIVFSTYLSLSISG